MNDLPDPTDDLFDGNAAAKWLSEALPEKTTAQWALWLRNNRNQSRHASYRISAQRFAGKAHYLLDDLTKFVEWEKSRQLGTVKLSGRAVELKQAFGLGESGGGHYGRKLTYEVQLVTENDPEKQFVRLMIERPLGVFRLEAGEAEALAKQLIDAAQAIRRHQGDTKPGALELALYETLLDSDSLTVRRSRTPNEKR